MLGARMFDRIESAFFLALFGGLTLAAIALSLIAFRTGSGDAALLLP